MDVPILDFDLSCENCGYNLRGLAVDRACPECGTRMKFCWRMALATNAIELRHWFRAKSMQRIADKAHCSIDATPFISDAVMFTSNIGHRSAREVCQDVISYARLHFNDTAEATQRFREWGIQGSEDVGRIVFAMVRAGLLRARPEDRQKDFNGLFRVDDVFRDHPKMP